MPNISKRKLVKLYGVLSKFYDDIDEEGFYNSIMSQPIDMSFVGFISEYDYIFVGYDGQVFVHCDNVQNKSHSAIIERVNRLIRGD